VKHKGGGAKSQARAVIYSRCVFHVTAIPMAMQEARAAEKFCDKSEA
jgi:hypothetical protein